MNNVYNYLMKLFNLPLEAKLVIILASSTHTLGKVNTFSTAIFILKRNNNKR